MDVGARLGAAVVLGAPDEVLCSRLPRFDIGIVTGGAAGLMVGAMEMVVPNGTVRGWKVGVDVSRPLERGRIVRIEIDTTTLTEESTVLKDFGCSDMIRVVVLVCGSGSTEEVLVKAVITVGTSNEPTMSVLVGTTLPGLP